MATIKQIETTKKETIDCSQSTNFELNRSI